MSNSDSSLSGSDDSFGRLTSRMASYALPSIAASQQSALATQSSTLPVVGQESSLTRRLEPLGGDAEDDGYGPAVNTNGEFAEEEDPFAFFDRIDRGDDLPPAHSPLGLGPRAHQAYSPVPAPVPDPAPAPNVDPDNPMAAFDYKHWKIEYLEEEPEMLENVADFVRTETAEDDEPVDVYRTDPEELFAIANRLWRLKAARGELPGSAAGAPATQQGEAAAAEAPPVDGEAESDVPLPSPEAPSSVATPGQQRATVDQNGLASLPLLNESGWITAPHRVRESGLGLSRFALISPIPSSNSSPAMGPATGDMRVAQFGTGAGSLGFNESGAGMNPASATTPADALRSSRRAEAETGNTVDSVINTPAAAGRAERASFLLRQRAIASPEFDVEGRADANFDEASGEGWGLEGLASPLFRVRDYNKNSDLIRAGFNETDRAKVEQSKALFKASIRGEETADGGFRAHRMLHVGSLDIDNAAQMTARAMTAWLLMATNHDEAVKLIMGHLPQESQFGASLRGSLEQYRAAVDRWYRLINRVPNWKKEDSGSGTKVKGYLDELKEAEDAAIVAYEDVQQFANTTDRVRSVGTGGASRLSLGEPIVQGTGEMANGRDVLMRYDIRRVVGRRDLFDFRSIRDLGERVRIAREASAEGFVSGPAALVGLSSRKTPLQRRLSKRG